MKDVIKAPTNLLCNGMINPARITNNTPVLCWKHSGIGTEKGYRVLVASSVEAIQSNKGDMWDTGHVWQWDFNGSNKKGAATYSGKPLKPGTEYYWKVMTWDEYGQSPFSEICSFTTSLNLKDAKEEVADIVFGEKKNSLYFESLRSIQDRIQEDGYCPESLTGGYYGQFVRGSSSAVITLLEIGDYQRSRKVIRYLCKKLSDLGVKRCPHVITKDDSYLCIEDQVDGHYHFVFAWARYIAETKDNETEYEFYPLLKNFTSFYLNEHYYNSDLDLLWCPSYEHARRNTYLSDYDLLTNVFAVEALKLMVPFAKKHGDNKEANLWEKFVISISEGIYKNLCTERDGKRIFGELRLKDKPEDLVFGMSFVNLSPICAESSLSHTGIMDNTMDIYERQASFMWGDHRVLFTNASPGQEETDIHKTNWQVIGKGLAWEMLYNAEKGRWNRLHILQDWLQKYNTPKVF